VIIFILPKNSGLSNCKNFIREYSGEILEARGEDIALIGFCGWSDKLADSFIDARNRRKVISAKTPKEAVELAISIAEETLINNKNVVNENEVKNESY
jgi:hypothetical protein